MGEKYDGVRCVWNPIRQKLYSRGGIDIFLSEMYHSLFSDVFLDTELWYRGNLKVIHAKYD